MTYYVGVVRHHTTNHVGVVRDHMTSVAHPLLVSVQSSSAMYTSHSVMLCLWASDSAVVNTPLSDVLWSVKGETSCVECECIELLVKTRTSIASCIVTH